ncbi:MAG: amino acid adenylation domain-containing protein [Desulfobacterales bacterium]|nr:amino acid adenylation domain-containing protein [Desulfobacterales bacterium]
MYDRNQTSSNFSELRPPLHRTIVDLFEVQAARTPDNIAVVYNGSDDAMTGAPYADDSIPTRLTYGELNAKANQLARFLIDQGIDKEKPVGICMDRSPEMIIGILGILKSGGAFLPMDPDYPEDRLKYMVEDSGISLILSRKHLGNNLPLWESKSIDTFFLDSAAEQLSGLDDKNLPRQSGPENLAYVIYTSGSTGKPKGVMVIHRGFFNLSAFIKKRFRINEESRVLQFSSFSFDAFCFEFAMAIPHGARFHLNTAERLLPSDSLADLILDQEISHMTLPPSALAALPHGEYPSLAYLIVAGEAISGQLTRRWSQGRTLINAYGPTEATVCATTATCRPDGERPPIGHPIDNTSVYILDHTHAEVPPGTIGELCISGKGLARGYLNRPEQTAEKFIEVTLSGKKERIYKTGDLARRQPATDGVPGPLEFHGRIDDQIKLRGFRIEPGEIEEVLSHHDSVNEAAVVPRANKSGSVLVAFIVTRSSETTPSPRALRRYLQKQLPEYMIPGAFVVLGAFPLTPNGKINREALTRHDIPAHAFPGTPSGEFTRPATETEKRLARIWNRLLNMDDIDIHAPFSMLGGHSLLAIQMVNDIRNEMGLELSLHHLFSSPTIEGIADCLDREANKAEPLPRVTPAPRDRNRPFPLTDVQQAYWLGRSTAFELGSIATHAYMELDFDHTVGHRVDLAALNRAWNLLIRRHDMLRMVMVDDRQQILDQVPSYEIPFLDLASADRALREEQLKQIREEMSHQVLDVTQWPLFDIRASHFDSVTRLHISLDILIQDAHSLGILFREWHTLYHRPEAELPELQLTFRDYVLAQEKLADTDAHKRSQNYWQDRLPTLPQAPDLPLAKSPGDVAPRFRRHGFHLEAPLWQLLKKRISERGLTPSAAILAAFSDILAFWSSTPHFMINLTLFNRYPLHPQVNDIVGDFTSLTLLEINPKPGDTFSDRAHRIQQQLWQDLDHQYTTGIQVLRSLARHRGVHGQALAPVVFTSALAVDMDDLKLLDSDMPCFVTQTPQVWLDHQVFEEKGALSLTWDVVEGLFPPGMIEDMFDAYRSRVTRLAENNTAWTEQGSLCLPEHQAGRRKAFNRTQIPLRDDVLQELFIRQVKHREGHIAVVDGDCTFTYLELFETANALGQQLIRQGLAPNQLAAVVMEKGWEQVVAVLGILMAGGAYLPIDPELPPERQDYLLDQGDVSLVLTQPHLLRKQHWPETVVPIPVTPERLPEAPPLTPRQNTSDLAYVIYTSGSTGTPKGVMIDHRGAVNTILDINRRFGITEADRVLALSNLNFDLSVYDIFGILAAGGTIVLPENSQRKDPSHWAQLMAAHRVTVWNSVPALMQMLVTYQETPPTGTPTDTPLKTIMMSGDWIPTDLPDRIRMLWPSADTISLGGATECSVWSVYYPVHRVDPDWKSIPYGRPLGNQRLYILDKGLAPCPVHVQGGIYIGGDGLALGYWKDEMQTAERFIIHPDTGERLYKTGDLGRFHPDGHIEFLGREDFQVKINGHRIELGEIEHHLSQAPEVKQCIVQAPGDGIKNEKSLVAYLVEEKTDDPSSYGMADDHIPLTCPAERLSFQLQQPGLLTPATDGPALPLPPAEQDEARYIRRQTYREFNGEVVTLEDLSRLLACLKPIHPPSQVLPKYRYASAGSLHPVQVYLYVKPEAVSGLPAGIYYYHPVDHQLLPINTAARMDSDLYTGINRGIFEQAAFSIFLMGDLDAITPMYGALGRDFCLLECGYMGQLLMEESPRWNLGLCPIGGFTFDPLRPLFGLKESQELLHSFIGGSITGEQQQTLPDRTTATPCNGGDGARDEQLKTFLRERLPGYMVPETFVRLDALPLTPNGKVDRKSLPVPKRKAAVREVVPPLGQLETRLQEIVQEALAVSPAGVTENFFSLGASSLQIVHIYTRVKAELRIELDVGDLFSHPTIRDLARHLEAKETAADPPGDIPDTLDAYTAGQLLANIDHLDEENLDQLLNRLSRETGGSSENG